MTTTSQSLLKVSTVASVIADIRIQTESNKNPNLVSISDIVKAFHERLKYGSPQLTFQEFVDTMHEAASLQK